MSDRDAARRKRLSEALRENLKRRKSQSRGRTKRGDGEEQAATHAPGDEPDDETA